MADFQALANMRVREARALFSANEFDGDELKRDRARTTSWLTVRSWNEQRRYARGIDQLIAAELLESIEDPKHGILVWVKQHW